MAGEQKAERGKRWLILKDDDGVFVLRSNDGRGFLLGRLAPGFQFTTAHRALLIADARRMRMALAEYLHGPAGHA